MSSSTSTPHDEYNSRILDAIADDGCISQRSLARDLGIALGLTNLLVRGLITRGLIRVSRIPRRRLTYLLTPAGVAEKARMSRLALARSVERYALARRILRDAFVRISSRRDWTGDSKRILFVGTGEVAEIGYVCLQETDLVLVGAVDDQGRERFFDVPVFPFESLTADLFAETGAERLVVMSLQDGEKIRARVRSAGLPVRRVVWL